MKISCIAVDDEPLALDILREYCAKVPFLNLQCTFDNALETLEYLRNNSVDLLLLDIQMEDLTGIQLLNALKTKPYVILTTAYDNYALQGFELDVADYLLKPISFERFVRGIDKVYERMLREKTTPFIKQENQVQTTGGMQDYFFVKTETRIEKINTSEVLYVEGMGDYWRIVTTNRRIMTLMNARGIEENLHEPRFCRVHKSWFVAIDKIDFVERKHIKIRDQRIPVSDTYLKNFFDIIEKRKK
ncbi:LytTR family DNA-binding domain-containing protein [Lentimicrobium sp.]|jgi:DNA-binding LytR/AlgR family response regulator|uniref:LytR/AlgR family response regulator transcription factor n=1 Tax=Lentimicrobium sp. TaxID=2034841 RepID=UPI0025E8368D|nr:LytTR family DNA-binding domain-containing protein [Lentimicrobium sp.]MCO5255751.1 LytTR family DNA-binding domain-containing protein [Lentimicrobium sp.]HOP13059.1 LytTR family DNA-binding domain-containing protein [Lentimicrobium sp.]HPF64633.1 LytTR family DNA-binding domain-containing protein [Lentimicrobium sp.]HPJ62982.1 LytTR family DNA-binding domain-containing protein [Lentimicrobium sp.]HPR25888.1 LytTR family DNA-binding domain-containing protein [Lentimicrobium sp.]